MDSMISSLKKLVSGGNGHKAQAPPAFYLQSTITNGMLPFTNASVEVVAFYDKEHYQKMANVDYSWFRKVQGRNYLVDNSESFYHFSTEDFGSEIFCIVTSKEHDSRKPKKECLKFGPLELAPVVRQEIENNLVSGSCMYSGFVRVNPKARANVTKNGDAKSQATGGQGEIRESKKLDDSVAGFLNFQQEIYKLEAILSHTQLQLYISVYSPLEARRLRFAQRHSHDSPEPEPDNLEQEPSIDMTSFLNVFDFQLQNDAIRPDLLKLYILQQTPNQDFRDYGLLFRDKENGMFYLELVFPKREDKEAFYATHRLVHALSKVDIFQVIHRLDIGPREENQKQLSKADRNQLELSLLNPTSTARNASPYQHPDSSDPKNTKLQTPTTKNKISKPQTNNLKQNSPNSSTSETGSWKTQNGDEKSFQTIDQSYHEAVIKYEDFQGPNIKEELVVYEDFVKGKLTLMSDGSQGSTGSPNSRSPQRDNAQNTSPRSIETYPNMGRSINLFGRYFKKNARVQINTGDLLLMYDTLGQVLQRNITYGKHLMKRNDVLSQRIEEMEVRSVQLSKELAQVSDLWKRSRKIDIQNANPPHATPLIPRIDQVNNSLLGIPGPGAARRFNDTMLLNYSLNRSKISASQTQGSLVDSNIEEPGRSLFKKKKPEFTVDEVKVPESLEIIEEVRGSEKKKGPDNMKRGATHCYVDTLKPAPARRPFPQSKSFYAQPTRRASELSVHMKSFCYDKEDLDKRSYLKVLMQMKDENMQLKRENSQMKREQQKSNDLQQRAKAKRRLKKEIMEKISVSVMDISLDLKHEKEALEVTFLGDRPTPRSGDKREAGNGPSSSDTERKREKLRRYLDAKRLRKRADRVNQSAFVRRGPSETGDKNSSWSDKKNKRKLEHSYLANGSPPNQSKFETLDSASHKQVASAFKKKQDLPNSAFTGKLGAGENLDISMQSNQSRFDEMRSKKKLKVEDGLSPDRHSRRQEKPGNVDPKSGIENDLNAMSRSVVFRENNHQISELEQSLKSEQKDNAKLKDIVGNYEITVRELSFKLAQSQSGENTLKAQGQIMKERIAELERELAEAKYSHLDRSVNQEARLRHQNQTLISEMEVLRDENRKVNKHNNANQKAINRLSEVNAKLVQQIMNKNELLNQKN